MVKAMIRMLMYLMKRQIRIEDQEEEVVELKKNTNPIDKKKERKKLQGKKENPS